MKQSPHEVINPAEALDKIILPRKVTKDELGGRGSRKADRLINIEVNRLLRVRACITDGEAIQPLHLEKMFLSAKKLTEEFGEYERPKFLGAVNRALQAYNWACKESERPMNKLTKGRPRESSVPAKDLQAAEDQFKASLSSASLDLKDKLLSIFTEHAASLKIPYEVHSFFKSPFDTKPKEQKLDEMLRQIRSYPNYDIRQHVGQVQKVKFEGSLSKKGKKKQDKKEREREAARPKSRDSFLGSESGNSTMTNDFKGPAMHASTHVSAPSAYGSQENYSQNLHVGRPRAVSNTTHNPPQAHIPQSNTPPYQPPTQAYAPRPNPPTYYPPPQAYVPQPNPSTYHPPPQAYVPQPNPPAYQPYNQPVTQTYPHGGNYQSSAMQNHHTSNAYYRQPQQGYYGGGQNLSGFDGKENRGYGKTGMNNTAYSGATQSSYGNQTSVHTQYASGPPHQQGYGNGSTYQPQEYHGTQGYQRQPYASQVGNPLQSWNNAYTANPVSATGSNCSAGTQSGGNFLAQAPNYSLDGRKRKSSPVEMKESSDRNEKKNMVSINHDDYYRWFEGAKKR